LLGWIQGKPDAEWIASRFAARGLWLFVACQFSPTVTQGPASLNTADLENNPALVFDVFLEIQTRLIGITPTKLAPAAANK